MPRAAGRRGYGRLLDARLALTVLAALALAGCQQTRSTPPATYGFATGSTMTRTAAVPVPNVVRQPSASIPAGARVVEFRARTGPDIIGHSYLIFGLQGADGSIEEPTQVGLYPREMSGFAIGIGGMAEATTEPVELDRSLPPSAVYRRELTEDEYLRLSAAVEAARLDPPTWNWTRYNCNTFVADMARVIGLRTPTASTLLAPAVFIHQLRALNT